MTPGHCIKHAVKQALKQSIKTIGRAKAPNSDLRILTYHSVGTRDHEMNVAPDAFRAQMAWLADNYEVLSPRELPDAQHGVVLTFDDGYEDNLRNAAPILADKGIAAVVFAVTDQMGGWLNHDQKGDASRLLSWEQLVELEEAGWEVGAHTLTHARLSHCLAEEQRQQILGAKEVLESRLGHVVRGFAYPYGAALDYDETSQALVRDAGFAWAVSNQYGPVAPDQSPWAMHRIWIDRTDTLASFRAKVEGRLDLLSHLDSGIGIRVRRVLNRMAGTQ